MHSTPRADKDQRLSWEVGTRDKSTGDLTMLTSRPAPVQVQLETASNTRQLTVFTPPGIIVESAKYPTMFAGVLASTRPSEHISIYDHPRAWKGFSRDAITIMRENLYRFLVPIDAREMYPREILDILRTIALSVTPLALGVEVNGLPPRRLKPLPGVLPLGPEVIVRNIEILSDPEISHVASKICEKDIPASEGAWRLLDYDYSLDQVVRFMALGMLGRIDKRRLVPTHGAYKAIIDSYVDRVIAEMMDRPTIKDYQLYMTNQYGDSFFVITQPGEARVDYIRAERRPDGLQFMSSIEGQQSRSSEPRFSVLSDHARFAAYKAMHEEGRSAHVIILHYNANPANLDLEPWLTRFGVSTAFQGHPAVLDSMSNLIALLQTVAIPDLSKWSENSPLFDRLGVAKPALKIL